MKKSSSSQLTPKQEGFCRAYVEAGNASEAYRRAYEPKKMKAKTITEKASRLRATPKIDARVRGLQGELRELTGVTLENLTHKLDQAYTFAMVTGQCAAAVSAVMAIAKLHGFLAEHHHATGEIKAIREMSNEQLNAEIAAILREIGFDATLLLTPAGRA